MTRRREARPARCRSGRTRSWARGLDAASWRRWLHMASARSRAWPADKPAPGRGVARDGQRHPAPPGRGDPTGHPVDHPRGVPPRTPRLRRPMFPAVDRRRRHVRSRAWSARWPRRSGARMLMTGARLRSAPVLDIARDPRWGRIEETYGEDPYLAAALGCRLCSRAAGLRTSRDGVVGDGQAPRRPRPGGGRANQAPVPTSAPASSTTSSSPRSRRRSPSGGRRRHAGLLRRRRRALSRLDTSS